MRLILCLIVVASAASAQTPQAVGERREHLPYNSTIDITSGNNFIYAATPYSLFTVNLTDNSVERMSRVTGLSETGISRIYFDEVNNNLIIAYNNSNIDIVHNHDIYNIPSIKRFNSSGDKTIYSIYVSGNFYYLSTGIGVVVVDALRYEVKDTWPIGAVGNPLRVNGFSSDATFFYAATAQGLKKAATTGINHADPANWIAITTGIGAGPVNNVFNLPGKIYAEKNDSLFVQNGSSWNFLYTDTWTFTNTNISGTKIFISEKKSTGISRVVVLNPDGTVSKILANSPAISLPRKAIEYKNETWVADQYAGLSAFVNPVDYRAYTLNSPQSVASGQVLVYNGVFYATAGEVNESWNYRYNGDGIFIFKEGKWNNINRYRYTQLDTLLDYIAIAIDKRDETIWAGSFGGGLLHIKPGPAFEILKQNALGVTVGDPGSYRVAGLAFDSDNNLWIANYGSTQQLKVRKTDGTIKGFSVPPPLFDNALSQIVIDNNNYKWIVAPLGNGLVCYDHGTSIDNTSDDRWKRIAAGTGIGNLPTNEVLCIDKDKNGFIWVGTSDGIAIIECPGEIFSAKGCDAVLPVVPNGNFAGLLFKGQAVRAIITDGANRKWVATPNGVFLVSSDGQKLIYHFTEDNSPLLSNDVKKLAIDSKTGEVWFATRNGICSFRGSATDGAAKNEDVLIFPNPVPPGYQGTISIRGLVNNAIVKITELDGRLVYQTRALGGQANWNGSNFKGQKISSGAYLVLVSDDGRKERIATKIFFIAR